MATTNWNDIKFIESAANLKQLLGKSVGIPPSEQIVREIAVNIEQGRLFFEAASAAPLQIKPLQIYYGALGFAKAVIRARTYPANEEISKTHGISDASKQSSRIEELSFIFRKTGVFQQFNDAIAPLARINYFDEFSTPQTEIKPFDKFQPMTQAVSIKDILSRIPNLGTAYEKTFNEKSSCLPVSFYVRFNRAELRIDDKELFTDRQSLETLVQKWRQKFPFLNQWCFYEAVRAWGASVLMFCNAEKPNVGEFSSHLVDANNGFGSPIQSSVYIPFLSILPPLAGGIVKSHQAAIQPLHELSLSEFSLQFCGAFLLSSLVRYRPQTWQYALSRSTFEQSPADDRALSLVEMFLQTVLADFPQLVVQSISSPA